MRILNAVALGLSLAIAPLANVPVALAQVGFFQRTLAVGLKDPVTLKVELSHGDVTIVYRRDGQVTIYAFAKDVAGKSMDEGFFNSRLRIEQKENQITVAEYPFVGLTDVALNISYRIEVPGRTEVTSSIDGVGNQTLMGVSGPAKVTSAVGNIEASFIGFGLLQATTSKGNISCSRVMQLKAESGDGNITLMETGPSHAVVKRGRGKIEVGGARGSFEGSTDSGAIHIRAIPHDNWRLDSVSGNIRVELPKQARFEVDASTASGGIAIDHEGIEQPDGEVRQFHQQVNGGGKRIEARSVSGTISIE